MKKLFLVVACAFVATASFAQRASSATTSFFSSERSDQPITIGIRAGVNFANASYEVGSYSLTPNSRTSFNVGLSVDFPILESFYIQSGLYYTQKGCEMKENGIKIEASPAYVEVPVLASYRYNMSESTQLQLNVGPYFAYGIGGKLKDGNDEYDYFDEDASTNKFDCGIQVGAGVTFGKVYLGCAYQFGMANGFDSSDITAKNKNFMINLGYNF